MQKFINLTVLFIFIGSLLAASQVLVPGNPPITMRAAQCHIGLIEFVLGTRLTVAQKDTFLEAIKTECATMSKQDKNNFLSACELVDSMQSMDQNGLNAVKAILQKDFEESAASLPDDPAAVLYLKIKKERLWSNISNLSTILIAIPRSAPMPSRKSSSLLK
jgi:hypothetical protein